jgi:hypothetical protein
MRKVEEYKKNAAECRAMARNSTNEEHRQGLIQMAETWESLAAERVRQIGSEKRIDPFDAD